MPQQYEKLLSTTSFFLIAKVEWIDSLLLITQLLGLMMRSYYSLQLYLWRDSVSLSVRERHVCNWRRLTRKSLAGSAEQSKTLDNIPASCLKINNPDPGGERTRDRPHTAVSFSPVHSPSHPSIFPSSTLRQKPQTQLCVSISPFQFFFVFLFSFTALFSKLGCRNTSEGYWEIAIKWFIIWLTFTTCMHFCACECMCKREERRAGKGAEACKFLVLISQLALNQGSKVGLAQQLWQDKHLFLCWWRPELSHYPQYVNLSKDLYTHAWILT